MTELKMIEPHKAEGVKELCYKAILSPDKNFLFMRPNFTLGERREQLLLARQNANKGISKIEKETDSLLSGDSQLTKQDILAMLDIVTGIAQLIDKYSIENTKNILRKHKEDIIWNLGRGVVNFPLTYEGDEVVVNCFYYEDISLNDKLFAEFTELEDEEKELEFLKKHVELSTVAVIKKEDAEKIQNYDSATGAPSPEIEPLYVNIDNLYLLDEVDK